MDASTELTSEQEVTCHHGLFSRCWLTRQAELGRPGSLVHHATRGNGKVLAVLGVGDAEAGAVVEGSPSDTTVLHAGAVIGEQLHTEGGELSNGGELLARSAHRDRPSDRHLRGRRRSKIEDRSHHEGAIKARRGIGHGHHCGVATECGSASAAGDGLGLLLAGLTQVCMEVDESRAGDATFRIEHCRTLRRRDVRLDSSHQSIDDDHVGVDEASRGQDCPSTDDHRALGEWVPMHHGWPPSGRVLRCLQ